ncbi:ribosome-associated protein [Desulfoscipio geothermicus DSM 3669]|uniref:Ribosomal silencing factor RsfS n=1 Tax=Desulfoscipio geothermicus DSM 3669 TaxID=1121426 RepID=A0A1I6DS79_9FIRM|nr:ribosome-associated protein [Desulfoscipio geothermicus DSM 3669]
MAGARISIYYKENWGDCLLIIEPQVLAQVAVEAAEEKKAMDITVLNIGGVSVVAEYFVICSSRSPVHARAIAEEIEKRLQQLNVARPRREGLRTGQWVLLDYGSVVVHIFQEEQRRFYNLEHLWGDAPVVRSPISI